MKLIGPNPEVPEMTLWLYRNAVSFLRSREEYGALQNMCGGLPIRIGNIVAPSSEALYQALKFLDPDDQVEILRQPNGFEAKRTAEQLPGYRETDERECLHLMSFVLKLKLLQHAHVIVPLLQRSGDKNIVEVSYKDPLWGAKPEEDGFVGRNALGLMWMELRDFGNACGWDLRGITVQPPDAPLMGHYIPAYTTEEAA